jgi:hypothetical protein
MKRWLSLLLLLWGITAVLVACRSQPQIAIPESRLALGNVVNGEIITRAVNVQNTGQTDLVIETVTTTCGCTEARLDPMVIPAGGSGSLEIVFDSGAHGPALTGAVVRQVIITSNDPQQPEMIVELAANILPPSGSSGS